MAIQRVGKVGSPNSSGAFTVKRSAASRVRPLSLNSQNSTETHSAYKGFGALRSTRWQASKKCAKIGRETSNRTLKKRTLSTRIPHKRNQVEFVEVNGEDAASRTDQTPQSEAIKIPRSIEEVDNGSLLGFGDDLAEDHPGYLDEEYKARRVMIGNLGRSHKVGQEIPRLQYTDTEIATWKEILDSLEEFFPRFACKEYLDAYALCDFSKEEVPQLQDMSELLQKQSGWSIRPVAGLLHPRDFLNGLAFKTFHSTQYMRHHSKPMYTPEPDVCHELIGHVPMLLNPQYAQLAHEIGLASLGASEKDIWHLTKVYWYTIEFGVVMQEGEAKAFGAGIISSYGEIQHQGAGKATLQKLDPYSKLPKMSYKDGYQQLYMTLDSFEDGVKLLRNFASSRPKSCA
ncbi:hypothetical protein CYMTET_43503 [Cymbomonas tetramitiformis]|uniref:phenylalanine 4-monooxygenase n=1 Tax=Cymbomonas tetramitiformis TaxID=36881 RepID=A0AAE0C447_9CHLO|nr:hypothetical protein CYMTET_43503 [Cymbomonas tetramitiformis]